MMPERYVPKRINEVKDSDNRIALLGKVIEKREDAFVLEDDSGKIEIFFTTEPAGATESGDDPDVMQMQPSPAMQKQNVDPARVKTGMLVRAFCTVAGERLNLDVLQDMTGLDINLLKTTEELYSKADI